MTCRRLHLERDEDVSGVSGTGTVAYGVEFPDGTIVLRWDTVVTSIVIYANVEDLVTITGHGGPPGSCGTTRSRANRAAPGCDAPRRSPTEAARSAATRPKATAASTTTTGPTASSPSGSRPTCLHTRSRDTPLIPFAPGALEPSSRGSGSTARGRPSKGHPFVMLPKRLRHTVHEEHAGAGTVTG